MEKILNSIENQGYKKENDLKQTAVRSQGQKHNWKIL